ncbi:MAG: hypothetical protein Q9191_002891 [Dirinaria sp. TL-2023a]
MKYEAQIATIIIYTVIHGLQIAGGVPLWKILFGALFGRPKISLRSLEDEFHPENAEDSPSMGSKGAFNAGVYVDRRKPDDRRCVEKRFRTKDISNDRAAFALRDNEVADLIQMVIVDVIVIQIRWCKAHTASLKA